MKLIPFEEQFPKRPSLILVYHKDMNVQYSIIHFGDSPIPEYNTYLYLVKKYTHWLYLTDLLNSTTDDKQKLIDFATHIKHEYELNNSYMSFPAIALVEDYLNSKIPYNE